MRTHLRMFVVLTLIFVFAFTGLAQATQEPTVKASGTAGVNTGYPLEKWRIDDIFPEGLAGQFASLALDPGHDQLPWISFNREFDDTTSDLWIATRVAIAPGNCGPANQWYCGSIVYEANKRIGGFSSIEIFPDINPDPGISTWKVGISYVNATDKTLNYAEYSCPAGECNWSHVVVNDLNPLVDYLTTTSLKFDASGHAHIAHQMAIVNGTLRYNLVMWAEWIGPGGNCGVPSLWHCEVIAQPQTNFSDEEPSLAISSDGTDAISFHDPVTGFLILATRVGGNMGNCGTDMNWNCETIDYRGFDVGLHSSLHAPLPTYLNGPWWIAYYSYSDHVLRLAVSDMNGLGNCGDGNNWKCSDIIDSASTFKISLDMIDYQSAVIAFSTATSEYPYTSLALASLSHIGAPMNCAQFFWCGTLDQGNATLVEGHDVSLKINDEGRAMIAYIEDDISAGFNDWNLKFATEQQWTFLPVSIR